MKRLGAVRAPLALLLPACAVGVPQPPTSPHPFGTSIMLNAKVASSIDGPTDYWFRYGERGDQANGVETPHETVEVSEGEAESVSAELTGYRFSRRHVPTSAHHADELQSQHRKRAELSRSCYL